MELIGVFDLFLQLAKTEGTVYATDSILATLMCSIRSNYSWDIIVQKVGGKLFFDKRDDSEFGNYEDRLQPSISHCYLEPVEIYSSICSLCLVLVLSSSFKTGCHKL